MFSTQSKLYVFTSLSSPQEFLHNYVFFPHPVRWHVLRRKKVISDKKYTCRYPLCPAVQNKSCILFLSPSLDEEPPWSLHLCHLDELLQRYSYRSSPPTGQGQNVKTLSLQSSQTHCTSPDVKHLIHVHIFKIFHFQAKEKSHTFLKPRRSSMLFDTNTKSPWVDKTSKKPLRAWEIVDQKIFY